MDQVEKATSAKICFCIHLPRFGIFSLCQSKEMVLYFFQHWQELETICLSLVSSEYIRLTPTSQLIALRQLYTIKFFWSSRSWDLSSLLHDFWICRSVGIPAKGAKAELVSALKNCMNGQMGGNFEPRYLL